MNKSRLSFFILLSLVMSSSAALESLTVGVATYQNVTLKKEYPLSFFIQHDGGMTFIKRSDLTDEQTTDLLAALGDVPAAPADETSSSVQASEKSEDSEDEPYDVQPGPESLASDEERDFFAACVTADTGKIKSMLAANPELAKASMVGTTYQPSASMFIDDGEPKAKPVTTQSTVNGLQALIDKAPKNPERLEAIKALVEGGVDPKAVTSEKNFNMARGTVSQPDLLTAEELDYLLGKGADPSFGFCVGNGLPMTKLALAFVTEQDKSKKTEFGEMLRIFVKNGADPAAAGGSSDTRQYGGKLADAGTVNSAAQVKDITQDPELVAILAGQ